MRGLIQDLRYGFRSFFKTPLVTVVALAALTLGIGANSAIFNVINAILIRPLPYKDASRLFVIWSNKLDKGMHKQFVSPLDFQDFAAQNRAFDRVGAFATQPTVLTGGELPERVLVARVSPSVFEMLGARAQFGRWFAPSEDQPARNAVAILSEGFWRRRFGGNSSVLGSPLELDGRTYSIVGIAPTGFQLLDGPSEIWIPYTPEPGELAVDKRGFRSLTVLGHLRPGANIEQARIETILIARTLADQNPRFNAGYSFEVVPLAEQMVGDAGPTLWTLFGAVGFVLLIACANVANLLLVRAGAREKEIAIRTSLGADANRIVRQLLTESLLLALAGGILGLALAYWATFALLKLAPADLPRAHEISVDWRVLAFTLGLSLVTGLLFGLAPAFAGARADLNTILKTSSRSTTGHRSRSRLRDLLVVFEVASCVVLLIGAGLLIRSFSRLQNVNPGFRVDHVLTMQLSLTDARYPGMKAAQFYRQLLDRTRNLPGVVSAGVCQYLPLSGRDVSLNFQIEGQPPATAADQPRAKLRAASADYFAALGIPLVRGRFFDRSDDMQTHKVVVINQLAADRYWPGQDPVGRRILSGIDTNEWSTVVGIAGNVKHAGLDAEISPETYYNYLQLPPQLINFFEDTMALAVRTSNDPSAMVSAIREQVRELDPNQPVFNVRTMRDVVSGSVAQPRFRTLVLSLFAFLALFLAALGLYGVMAYSVTQRTNELGVRSALGATSVDILRLIVVRGLALAGIGLGIGLVLALIAMRLLGGLLFNISPFDPITLGLTCGMVLLVSLMASLVPAWRATKINPITALRTE